MSIVTVNPASAEIIKRYPYISSQQVNDSIKLAHNQYLAWKCWSVNERQKLLTQLAISLTNNKQQLSELITLEMGKPITQACAEINKCIALCQHFAQHSESYLASRLISTELSKTEIHYRPLGVILIVMPWNFPFWQVLRCAIPALMTGNAVLLKHAPITSGSALAISRLIEQAEFPKGLFQSLIIDNSQTEKLLKHPVIKGLSFTGSEKVGAHLGSLAAASLKKSVLELGGSDPYLVLADADLDLAAETIVASRLANCGQVCIAAKRIIVHSTVHDELVSKLLHYMAPYVPDDPSCKSTRLGPMARNDLRQNLMDQVARSVSSGAKLITGGKCVQGAGYFYEPALLTNVRPGMSAFEEELFGPVLAVTQSSSEKHMIELANQSIYGLGAAIFSSDLKRAEQIATFEIESGSCFINASVVSDPRVPFGGVKHSGYGRELSSEGIHEFTNIKTIAIR